jgi:hypothetical protein
MVAPPFEPVVRIPEAEKRGEATAVEENGAD